MEDGGLTDGDQSVILTRIFRGARDSLVEFKTPNVFYALE
jgi:hypothetical protein